MPAKTKRDFARLVFQMLQCPTTGISIMREMWGKRQPPYSMRSSTNSQRVQTRTYVTADYEESCNPCESVCRRASPGAASTSNLREGGDAERIILFWGLSRVHGAELRDGHRARLYSLQAPEAAETTPPFIVMLLPGSREVLLMLLMRACVGILRPPLYIGGFQRGFQD